MSALLWLGWQKIYINMQVGLSRYDAIYGTFASIPIFLLWLSVCWMIVLLGSEIAFALQHHVTYHLERSAGQASMQAKVSLAVAAVLEAARALSSGRPVLNVSDYAPPAPGACPPAQRPGGPAGTRRPDGRARR